MIYYLITLALKKRKNLLLKNIIQKNLNIIFKTILKDIIFT